MPVTGQCLCGAVRYRADAEPLATRLCWCRVCQYIGAGSATVNAIFPRAAVTIEGELRDYRSIADSGNVMHRRFCLHCGTHLFSEAESRPQVIIVRIGTFDSPGDHPPQQIIWAGSAPAWACLDDSLPQVAGQPPPA